MHTIINDDAPPEGQEDDDDADDGEEEYDDEDEEDIFEGEPDTNGETEKTKRAKNRGVCWKNKEDTLLGWILEDGHRKRDHRRQTNKQSL